jgi:hypothetical protein
MRRTLGLAALIFCVSILANPVPAATCTSDPWIGMAGVPPLTDFPPGYLYLGIYPGFLYDGSNALPPDHDADGRALGANIQPRDHTGQVCSTPGPDCKIVFLSIGFSNNTIEFCGGIGIGGDPEDPAASPCPLPTSPQPYIQTESFIAQALLDPAVNHGSVVLVDGAKGGQTYVDWDPLVSGFGEYDRVRDAILTPSGLSEAQVGSIWVKDAEADPTVSLAAGGAGNPPDAVIAERYLGDIMRAIRLRYPNAQQVFVSPRIYAGYANTAFPPNPLNPEPYAYEIGFSIKWLIKSQIEQVRGSAPDGNAGDLDYKSGVAPWIAWGPYLWANGTTPRSDGLVWLNSDFRYPYPSGSGVNECTHPSVHAELKVAGMLLNFMKTAPSTTWFLAAPAVCTLPSGSLAFGADKQTFSWESNLVAGPFDIAKGHLAVLRSSGGNFGAATCYRNDIGTMSAMDTEVPPSSQAIYYLVRCGGGTWDDGTQKGNRDTTLGACP